MRAGTEGPGRAPPEGVTRDSWSKAPRRKSKVLRTAAAPRAAPFDSIWIADGLRLPYRRCMSHAPASPPMPGPREFGRALSAPSTCAFTAATRKRSELSGASRAFLLHLAQAGPLTVGRMRAAPAAGSVGGERHHRDPGEERACWREVREGPPLAGVAHRRGPANRLVREAGGAPRAELLARRARGREAQTCKKPEPLLEALARARRSGGVPATEESMKTKL